MIIGKTVHKLETCTSTNDVARVFAEDGFEEGLVILAQGQQSGRGTQGRTWFSPKGKGLYLSVILRPEGRSPALLPLVAGLALREAVLSATGLETDLKWPNDLTWQGKKLAGILSESSWSGSHLNFVILGLGLNVGHAAEDFLEELRGTASSLLLALGRTPDTEALLRAIYLSLNRWYDVYEAGREAELLKAAEAALRLAPGAKVTLETKSGSIVGIFRGLRPDGRIALRSGGRERLLDPSDVSAVTAER
jgi:BirA family biotin operon repressor/biotin-[acetyl-CoA-carboxylase] ligase